MLVLQIEKLQDSRFYSTVGEIGRGSLVGTKVGQTISSPITVHIFSLFHVGGVKVKIFGISLIGPCVQVGQ